jgi:hypothetical protein
MFSLHTALLHKSTHSAVQPKLYRSFIISILAFGLYLFAPTQAQAGQQEVDVGFTVIPEPDGGKMISYPLDTVIQDAERWDNFWNDLHPGTPVPAIDFERRMAVVVALGGGTATSAIKVTRVTRNSVSDLSPLNQSVHKGETAWPRVCDPVDIHAAPSRVGGNRNRSGRHISTPECVPAL